MWTRSGTAWPRCRASRRAGPSSRSRPRRPLASARRARPGAASTAWRVYHATRLRRTEACVGEAGVVKDQQAGVNPVHQAHDMEAASTTGASALDLQAAILEAYANRQVDLHKHESAAAEVVDVAAVAARAEVARAKQLQKAAERQAHLLDG